MTKYIDHRTLNSAVPIDQYKSQYKSEYKSQDKMVWASIGVFVAFTFFLQWIAALERFGDRP